MVGVVAVHSPRRAGGAESLGRTSTVSVAVRVEDVLDQVKAKHRDEVIDGTGAEMLVALADGVIRGAQAGPASAWASVLGPVIKPGLASRLLGISTTALDKRRDVGAVLGVRTESGRWVYPLVQFRSGPRGIEVLAGLRDVLGVLHEAVDGLAAARWLATPNRRLDGSTPWEALGVGMSIERIVAAARAQVAAWSGR